MKCIIPRVMFLSLFMFITSLLIAQSQQASTERTIKDYVHRGIRAEADNRIDDALMNYTWALALLRSYPQGADVRDTIDGKDESLTAFLPDRIDKVFAALRFACALEEYNERKHEARLLLRATYEGDPVQNLEIQYYMNGQPSFPIGMRDGACVIDYPCAADKTPAEIQIEVSYAFLERARAIPDVFDVLTAMPAGIFEHNRYEVSVSAMQPPAEPSVHSTVGDDETTRIMNSVKVVTDAILRDDYDSVRSLLTPEGAVCFERIIRDGRPELVGPTGAITIEQFDDRIIVRGLKMQFAFKSNRRTFAENVVFAFRQDGLIDKIGFGLSEAAVQDIFGSVQADDIEKRRIRAFLEDYQTAYCLKDIDYLQKVFSDEALIIVGKVLKSDSTNISDLYNHLGDEKWRATQRAKQDFLARLKKVFDSNEYVNLVFTDNTIERSKRPVEHLFGMQLHQYFYSQNYSDAGYLFIMFDLQDPAKPRIYVRTWQLDKNTDGSIFGLSDFR